MISWRLFCDQTTAGIVPNKGGTEKYPSSHSRVLPTEKPHSIPGSGIPHSIVWVVYCLDPGLRDGMFDSKMTLMGEQK